MMNNVERHKLICSEINDLYKRKNEDYGDSFGQSWQEEGHAMLRIRLGDKLNRYKSITKSGKQNVLDESIRDTLVDLANYAIMGVIELDKQKECEVQCKDVSLGITNVSSAPKDSCVYVTC